VTICRGLRDIQDAALKDHDGPMDQDTADVTAAILATAQPPQAA
jgi:hypothetical protein